MSAASIVIAISIFFGVSRLYAPSHELSLWGTWEAFAHIWVGFLIAAGMFGPEPRLVWGCLAAITAVEVVMFAKFKLGKAA